MLKFNKQDKQQLTAFCKFQCAVMLRYCSRYNATQTQFANIQAEHFCDKHTL